MVGSELERVSLISFGEILWDIVDGQAKLGGAPLNLAANAAGLGVNAYLLSCVGDDDLGHGAVIEAKRLGVDVSGVQCSASHPTGTVLVTLSDGQPEYDIVRDVAWDYIEPPPELHSAASLGGANAICFGTLAQRGEQSRQALHSLVASMSGVALFYDVNLRQQFYTAEIVKWGLERARIVKVNDAEADILSRLLFDKDLSQAEFARAVIETFGVAVVLVTLGADGCLVATPSAVTRLEGYRVKVVDTIGAGDAFSAGFLSAWLRGKSPLDAAAIGNALGAYTATQRGGAPNFSNEFLLQLAQLSAGSRLDINYADVI
jgi:fructokinase